MADGRIVQLLGTLAIMVLPLAAAAGCPTDADLRQKGIWVQYEGALATSHLVLGDGGILTDRYSDPGPIIGTTTYYDGFYPRSFHEQASANAPKVLIAELSYEAEGRLPKLRAGMDFKISGQRRLTDAALTGQPARVEDIVMHVRTGDQSTLTIGSCRYAAIDVRYSISADTSTIHTHGYFLPDLGFRIYRSAGMDPLPELIKYEAASIAATAP